MYRIACLIGLGLAGCGSSPDRVSGCATHEDCASGAICMDCVCVAPTAVLPEPIFYVDPEDARARDEGPGTADEPFATIGAAASIAPEGATILVAPGPYREVIRPASDGLRFIALGEVVVRGAFDGCDGTWQIEGFAFVDTSGEGICVGPETTLIDVEVDGATARYTVPAAEECGE